MIALLAALLQRAAPADSSVLRAPVNPPAVVTAVRVTATTRPVIDGRVDEAVWATATPISGLLQRDPQEGAPATERVEVRILYDADALYVGARLFDSDPQRVIRRLGRRDASTHSDEFRVLLDSYHDRRTAFEFSVNAAGVKPDVLLGDDGGYSDDSWDAVWEAATAFDSLGWGAYRGFKELRAPQTFTFNTYGRDNGSTVTPGDSVCSGAGPTQCSGVDPDGAGPAKPFALYNPDFRTRSLSIKAVWRWEYRPGSTVFFAWTHSRSGYFPYDASFDVARDLGRELLLERPTNVLLVKLNFWLSR